ncbi:MAG: LysM peptidoglycan-binding domain-containing protein [Nitrososphaerales archaeon]
MRFPRVRPPQVFLVFALLSLLCFAAPVAAAQESGQPQSGGCSGYYYTVKRGDTWSIISRRVGAPVSSLKAANQQSVRPRDLIYAGERLCVPSQGGGVEEGGYWYQVKPGDTWNKVSRATGVPVQQLWEANRQLVNSRQWLYIGQRVWIPALPKGAAQASVTPVASASTTATSTGAGAAQTAPTVAAVEVAPAATATASPAALPTATATASPEPTATPVPTSTPTATPSPVPTATATSTATALPAATATATATTPASLEVRPYQPTPTPPANCPRSLTGYGDAIASNLNKSGYTPDTLQAWLVACGVVSAGVPGVTVAPITKSNASDLIAVVNAPDSTGVLSKGLLLVYHKGSAGYTLSHKHEGQGRVALVKAADVNLDGKFDLVYSDTSCGAHTCFGTLFVDSWDGKVYADSLTGDPTMAEPEYSVKDATADGQGSEILVHGGVIQSVGAGPQRAWTETYYSPKGAPYALLSQAYDPSTCLYFKVLDANRAFDAWALDGFDPAVEAYKAAIADKGATACGTIKDEVATLRDFARFRLIVADVAGGSAAQAVPLAPQITNTALKGAATTFLTSYETNGSVIQACRDTTKYAAANPASWQFLADWGYANPSFTAQDLCPLN